MKTLNVIFSVLFLFGVLISHAQVKQIDLKQTDGQFTTESLKLSAGEYKFNISNINVDHEVGFVLVPKGNYDQESHIKEAYVKAAVPTGKSSSTDIVHLEAGEYEYFCPLNPTPKYSLTVLDEVQTIKLDQVPGTFSIKSLTVSKGNYQFEISNSGVDHNVGFVLVPKGKYEEANHIKAAYVKAPVADGKNSLTGIVNLEAGEYEYFCPLNPTPKYNLTVK